MGYVNWSFRGVRLEMIIYRKRECQKYDTTVLKIIESQSSGTSPLEKNLFVLNYKLNALCKIKFNNTIQLLIMIMFVIAKEKFRIFVMNIYVNAACYRLDSISVTLLAKEFKEEYMMVVTFGTCPTFPK